MPPHQRQSVLHVSHAGHVPWQLTITTLWREDGAQNLDWQEEVRTTYPETSIHGRQLRRVKNQWFSAQEGGPWIHTPDLNTWATHQVQTRDQLFLQLLQQSAALTPRPEGYVDSLTPHTRRTFSCARASAHTTTPAGQRRTFTTLRATPPTIRVVFPKTWHRHLTGTWRISDGTSSQVLEVTLDDTLTLSSDTSAITPPMDLVTSPPSPCLTHATDQILQDVMIQHWRRQLLSTMLPAWSHAIASHAPLPSASPCR